MAKRQVVSYSYTCDVCGDAIPESDGGSASRKLSLEGADFAIDVCATHGSELSDVLSKLKGFADAGHRSLGRRGRRPGVAKATTSAPRAPRVAAEALAVSPPEAAPAATKAGGVSEIRAWARANGHTVNERGRIPGPVMAAYQAATAAPAAAKVPARRGRPRKVVG